MIEILVVDDNDAKVALIRKVIDDVMFDGNATVDIVGHVAGAFQRLSTKTYDLMIVDMNIPIRAESAPDASGGMLLLKSLSLRSGVFLPHSIVGLSEFDELIARHEAEFHKALWFLIKYDDASDQWRERLGRHIAHIAGANDGASGDGYQCDLGVITALKSVELESVLALEKEWAVDTSRRDDVLYHKGAFVRDGKRVNVVAAHCVEMGMAASTAAALNLIYAYRPRYLAMTGIAAGVDGNFGDVLVADTCWDYGSGKSVARGKGKSMFLPAPTYIPVSAWIKYRLSQCAGLSKTRRAIMDGWMGERPNTELDIKLGPLASGAAVVQDRKVVDGILQRDRKLIGVEMEAYGVFMAVRMCSEPKPCVMVMKSICDFGDANKGDEYQKYAAYTSARFLYEFAIEWLADGEGIARASFRT